LQPGMYDPKPKTLINVNGSYNKKKKRYENSNKHYNAIISI